MSVSLSYLYKKSEILYRMKLIAGEKGLHQPVQWIHMIEKDSSASFLLGGELVFMTGVLYTGTDWLLQFIARLISRRAAGIVINIGPYIDTIPPKVIQFCNDHEFPLFTLPWDVHLVDITRHLCRYVINEEQKQQTISTLLQQALFLPETAERCQMQLRSFGVAPCKRCCVAVLSVRSGSDDIRDVLTTIQTYCEFMLEYDVTRCCIFPHNENLILVFIGLSRNTIEDIIKQIYDHTDIRHHPITIGIGSTVSDLSQLSKSYIQAKDIGILALKRGQYHIFYQDIGVYKLLLNGNDESVLREFHQEMLGKLEKYDETNQTHYIETLKFYLENNSGIQTTAQHEVVHRNTIIYQLKKINECTGYPVNIPENRMLLLLAYKIKNLF